MPTNGRPQKNAEIDAAIARASGTFDLDQLPELYRHRMILSFRAQAAYQPRPFRGRLAYLQCAVRPLVHGESLGRRLARGGDRPRRNAPHPRLAQLGGDRSLCGRRRLDPQPRDGQRRSADKRLTLGQPRERGASAPRCFCFLLHLTD